MSAIYETYKRGHNIFELYDILLNFYLTTTETESDY